MNICDECDGVVTSDRTECCSKEAKGYLENETSTECSFCLPPKFYDEVNFTCSDCSEVERGYLSGVSEESAGICKKCPLNEYYDSTEKTCSACDLKENNSYLDANGDCVFCENFVTSTTTCEPCNNPTTFYFNGNICADCVDG